MSNSQKGLCSIELKQFFEHDADHDDNDGDDCDVHVYGVRLRL
jgi:hypothetical protein